MMMMMMMIMMMMTTLSMTTSLLVLFVACPQESMTMTSMKQSMAVQIVEMGFSEAQVRMRRWMMMITMLMMTMMMMTTMMMMMGRCGCARLRRPSSSAARWSERWTGCSTGEAPSKC
jgi:hypothetical protein